MKIYAAVYGESKENNKDSPILFWKVMFGLRPGEVQRGVTSGYIKAATPQSPTEEKTVERLRKISGKRITWKEPPVEMFAGYPSHVWLVE